ncbi:MAG TPA: peptidoglycan-binding domain-containing protein [Candidatus Eisenbacteria bacterium]|nr:peptidoglycan-binding domain-containing protein [Candidatus Eisenbacteria bacterium]
MEGKNLYPVVILAAIAVGACSPAHRGDRASGVSAPRSSTAPPPSDYNASPGAQGSSGGITNQMSKDRETRGDLNEVARVQEALKERGYDPGPVNGVMNEQTRAALRAFQSARNLRPTGTLDAETARALGIQSSPAGASSRPEPGYR